MDSIDFASSYFLWETHSGSLGRFQVESITILQHEDDNFIWLLTPAVACEVYGKNPLFCEPPYFFTSVFNKDMVKIFRNYRKKNADTVNKVSDIFSSIKPLLHEALRQKIVCIEDLKLAVTSGKQIIGKFRVETKEIPFQTIYFPVKHINISVNTNEFQVETGLVLYHPKLFKNSAVAFIAFNNYTTVDFMIFENNSYIQKSLNGTVELYFT